MEAKQTLIVIVGPTAAGKTKLAVKLAVEIGGEIISADSRQVYKGMNIGTGKDYEEYVDGSGKIIPYHLIDIVEAGDEYHVARFQQDFSRVYQGITERKKVPILCGGTGMYIEAVIKNYQHTQVPIDTELRSALEKKDYHELLSFFEETYQKVFSEADISTKKRLIRAIEIGRYLSINTERAPVNQPYHYLIFGISVPTEIRRERITRRLYKRLANGMIEEVQHLLNSGVSPEKLIFYGLEYKFITEYLLGQLAYEEMAKKLEIAIHQFAKRQMTFFRSMEKRGMVIHWLDGLDTSESLVQQMSRQIQAELN